MTRGKSKPRSSDVQPLPQVATLHMKRLLAGLLAGGLAIGIKFLGHSHWWRKLTASSGASGFRNFREPLTFLSNIRELTRV